MKAIVYVSMAALLAAAPAAAQRIEVPARVTAGEPVPVAIVGLLPGASVTLRAERIEADYSGPKLFASHATFVADAQGRIDLATAAPISGDYSGADASGPFWSMRAVEGAPTGLAANEIRLSALVNDKTVAEARILLAHGDARVVADAVPGFPGAKLYHLPGGGRRPVIVLLGGSEGGASFADEAGPMWASIGYAALGLPYYSPDWGYGQEIKGLPDAFADIPVDRLEAARTWLAAQPGIDASRIGLYGVSKGGEFAILAASRFPWLRAVAAVVPSDVVWEAFGKGIDVDGVHSSFAWRGKPLPFVPYKGMRETIARLFKETGVRLRVPQDEGRWAHPERAAAARIAIERYRGALLVAGGARDGTWASGPMAQAIAERRAEAGLATQLLVFPNAGHGISGTGYEPAVYPGVDGDPGANAHAQASVRAAAIAMFARVLRP